MEYGVSLLLEIWVGPALVYKTHCYGQPHLSLTFLSPQNSDFSDPHLQIPDSCMSVCCWSPVSQKAHSSAVKVVLQEICGTNPYLWSPTVAIASLV